jgi:hypothetical protein
MDIYPWDILNLEAREIVDKILLKWDRLLNDEEKKEHDYQRFLTEHAGFLLSDGNKRIPVISKLKLSDKYETDFVRITDDRSLGFKYELIEIKTPYTQLFKEDGDATQKLNHSLEQIRNWDEWITKNRGQAKNLFPSQYFNFHERPYFGYTIFVGRRSMGEKYLVRRHRYMESNNIQIRTFDSLTDSLRERSFNVIPKISSPEWNMISLQIRNQLSNPFFKAYSHKEWKNIVQDFKSPLSHLVAKNANTFLKYRKYNESYEEFKSYWGNFTHDEKKIRIDAFLQEYLRFFH